ncbi:pre-mRNA 3'-end-processing factor fip1 [Anaeramoeba flamelloides]|uniref:Pre-mRNA 3'-end-processing factor fip1 n=1 Tax=Anaeramoeba flamelloides TaxID=1746091 RepID=A0AAV7YUJ6_9EUKA|nr:pre-mRNA 3'-end-processing factor fip1 [Anaeramoeba flamelloides]
MGKTKNKEQRKKEILELLKTLQISCQKLVDHFKEILKEYQNNLKLSTQYADIYRTEKNQEKENKKNEGEQKEERTSLQTQLKRVSEEQKKQFSKEMLNNLERLSNLLHDKKKFLNQMVGQQEKLLRALAKTKHNDFKHASHDLFLLLEKIEKQISFFGKEIDSIEEKVLHLILSWTIHQSNNYNSPQLQFQQMEEQRIRGEIETTINICSDQLITKIDLCVFFEFPSKFVNEQLENILLSIQENIQLIGGIPDMCQIRVAFIFYHKYNFTMYVSNFEDHDPFRYPNKIKERIGNFLNNKQTIPKFYANKEMLDWKSKIRFYLIFSTQTEAKIEKIFDRALKQNETTTSKYNNQGLCHYILLLSSKQFKREKAEKESERKKRVSRLEKMINNHKKGEGKRKGKKGKQRRAGRKKRKKAHERKKHEKRSDDESESASGSGNEARNINKESEKNENGENEKDKEEGAEAEEEEKEEDKGEDKGEDKEEDKEDEDNKENEKRSEGESESASESENEAKNINKEIGKNEKGENDKDKEDEREEEEKEEEREKDKKEDKEDEDNKENEIRSEEGSLSTGESESENEKNKKKKPYNIISYIINIKKENLTKIIGEYILQVANSQRNDKIRLKKIKFFPTQDLKYYHKKNPNHKWTKPEEIDIYYFTKVKFDKIEEFVDLNFMEFISISSQVKLLELKAKKKKRKKKKKKNQTEYYVVDKKINSPFFGVIDTNNDQKNKNEYFRQFYFYSLVNSLIDQFNIDIETNMSSNMTGNGNGNGNGKQGKSPFIPKLELTPQFLFFFKNRDINQYMKVSQFYENYNGLRMKFNYLISAFVYYSYYKSNESVLIKPTKIINGKIHKFRVHSPYSRFGEFDGGNNEIFNILKKLKKQMNTHPDIKKIVGLALGNKKEIF